MYHNVGLHFIHSLRTLNLDDEPLTEHHPNRRGGNACLPVHFFYAALHTVATWLHAF